MSHGFFEAWELITPLVSTTWPAGSHQQVMSPTRTGQHGATGGNASNPTPPLVQASSMEAAGRAQGLQTQVSTTSVGGNVGAHRIASVLGQTLGGSSRSRPTLPHIRPQRFLVQVSNSCQGVESFLGLPALR